MSYEKSFSSPLKSQLSLQPAPAWAAIFALAMFTALSILAGAGQILNLAFPAGTFAVGTFLYVRYPILYLGFSWWIWILAPLIRRLADYRSSFTDPSPILLAPYLVAMISLMTLLQHLPRTHRQGGLPFILTSVSLFYGLTVGLIYRPPLDVAIATLDWLAPVLFGFHLFANWQHYPNIRQNLQRVFVWSVLVMGIYGIVQYLFLPEWDRFWLLNASISSVGKPEPMNFRIWSTLNSGEPFAAFMAAALLFLFNCQEPLYLPAAVAGYLAFLLSMVRSAWVGWFVGLLTLLTSLQPRLQARLLLVMLVMTLAVIPLATIEPFSTNILHRLETFSSLGDDGSANARKATYTALLNSAVTSLFGQGLGGPKHDSNLLAMLLDLGWLGTIFYLGGLLLLLFVCFYSQKRFDPFLASTRAAMLSILVRIPLNSALLGISGTVLWGFLGISLAAKKYEQHRSVMSYQARQRSLPPVESGSR